MGLGRKLMYSISAFSLSYNAERREPEALKHEGSYFVINVAYRAAVGGAVGSTFSTAGLAIGMAAGAVEFTIEYLVAIGAHYLQSRAEEKPGRAELVDLVRETNEIVEWDDD